ncbi:MAG: MarR family transcriptional regulator [Acidimicrobiia bacterium]|nr:MarR family transcriptional regulator [Acidimicrobiia bacterium]
MTIRFDLDEETLRRSGELGLAWRFLRRASPAVVLDASADIIEPKLEVGDVDALEQLALAGGECSMSEIATGLQVDRSTATRAVDRLVERGLVERRRDRVDARMIRARLTATGTEISERLRGRRLAFAARVLDRFDLDDQKAIARLVPRLADAVAEELGLATHRAQP